MSAGSGPDAVQTVKVETVEAVDRRPSLKVCSQNDFCGDPPVRASRQPSSEGNDSSSYRGIKVLVTGADGFIGSHLTESLVRRGADVTALCLYNSFDRHGWLDDLPEVVSRAVATLRGDVRDAAFVRNVVKGQEIVFHLAALIAIPHSYVAVQSYVETNILGTLNVLDAARETGVRRVVHTSTSEVVWYRDHASDNRVPPVTRAVAVFCVQGRRRHDGRSVCLLLWPPGCHFTPVQHLWPAPKRARGHPGRDTPGARPNVPGHQNRRCLDDSGFHLRGRHRGGISGHRFLSSRRVRPTCTMPAAERRSRSPSWSASSRTPRAVTSPWSRISRVCALPGPKCVPCSQIAAASRPRPGGGPAWISAKACPAPSSGGDAGSRAARCVGNVIS